MWFKHFEIKQMINCSYENEPGFQFQHLVPSVKLKFNYFIEWKQESIDFCFKQSHKAFLASGLSLPWVVLAYIEELFANITKKLWVLFWRCATCMRKHPYQDFNGWALSPSQFLCLFLLTMQNESTSLKQQSENESLN